MDRGGRGGEVTLVVRVLVGVEVDVGDNGEVGRRGEEVPGTGIERRFGLLLDMMEKKSSWAPMSHRPVYERVCLSS